MTQAAAAETSAARAAAAGGGEGEGDVPPSRRLDPARERARLETFVGRMERRYEYGSDEMLARLQAGAQKCTAEISLWMFNYRSLVWSRDGYDPATGERSEMWEPPETAARRGA